MYLDFNHFIEPYRILTFENPMFTLLLHFKPRVNNNNFSADQL